VTAFMAFSRNGLMPDILAQGADRSEGWGLRIVFGSGDIGA
jgi:hypothetical protein